MVILQLQGTGNSVRNSRSILVLLLAAVFGVSLLLPTEDILETPYDESEPVSFEDTPVFSIQAPRECARTGRANLSLATISAP